MPKTEDIIFLGAGASAPEGAPLQNALFREYFVSYRENNLRILNHDMDKELIAFFKHFFGIDVEMDDLRSVAFPTFEEVLGMLELALNRNEGFKEYSMTASNPKIQKIREYVILLIALILHEKLQEYPNNHRNLLQRLHRENRLLKTGFVSLNYDIIIDNALTELQPQYDLNYGVHFTNYDKQNDWKKPEYKKAIPLYKLHGSLNWLYCPTCISLTLTPQEKGIIRLRWQPDDCLCPKCNSLIIPIVIPPTFFKVMSNYYLQEIWRWAEIVLSKANRIIFCGYSFPDADIHIKYLLKRVEINKGLTPEIIIVNNHEGKSDFQKSSEKLRYKRFFRDKNKVRYTQLSFEEFCSKGI
jgi:hypothetical protein